MRDAKRGGGAGVEEALGPVDFAVGSGKSRAVARILAEQVEREPERVRSNKRGKEPWRNPKLKITVTRERHAYGGGLVHLRFTPVGLSAEDARRWMEEYGGTGDSG